MTTQIPSCNRSGSWLSNLVPALDWLVHYQRKHLLGDVGAYTLVTKESKHLDKLESLMKQGFQFVACKLR